MFATSTTPAISKVQMNLEIMQALAALGYPASSYNVYKAKYGSAAALHAHLGNVLTGAASL
jgi:hypothetical protein